MQKRVLSLLLALVMLLGLLPALRLPAEAANITINATNFPDANFRTVVMSFDENNDNSLSESELTAVKAIDCGSKGISNLKGIEYFTALEVLNCWTNQLTSLDLSHCPALRMLSCQNNALTSLNLAQNVNLTLVRCDQNRINVLKIGNNPVLNHLDCQQNDILVLDLSGADKLKDAVLNGTQNGSSYSTDSGVKLFVDSTVTLLTDSRGVAISAANFPDANFRSAVTTFDTNGNNWLSSAELIAAQRLDCAGQNIASLQGIGFFGNLQRINCANNQLKTLDLRKNLKLTVLHCYNNQLTTLDVSKCTQMQELYCHNNQLPSLNVKKLPELICLACGDNPLGSLDVSKNQKLEKLYCYQNQLTNLYVSENSALKILSCFGNNLPALGLTKNSALKELYCQENQITMLFPQYCPGLTVLSCYGNQIKSLYLGKNPDLVNLDCHNNQMTALDISQVSGLNYAYKRGYRADFGTYYRYQIQIATLFVDKNVSLTVGKMCPFSDVQSLDPYYEAVLWAYYHSPIQITAGTDATHFSPADTVTRGQAVTFFWNAAGRPAPANTKNPFTDNKSGKYYYNAVLWAYYNNPQITNGTSTTTFSPNKTCTRAQIITFLWNALGRPSPTISNPYSDLAASKYYYKAALWAYEKGIEKGSGGKFSADTKCTRAAIVAYLYRYYTGKDLAT